MVTKINLWLGLKGCRRRLGKEEGIPDGPSGMDARMEKYGAWVGKGKWNNLLPAEEQQQIK